ncbi:MAG: bifunctional diguanylate cyclase/phosphodiesterase [Actinomycetota bacterium]|nr:bifunctional diguanylate cyclase/phosphodiesterase [Actinomycetota bacterium]
MFLGLSSFDCTVLNARIASAAIACVSGVVLMTDTAPSPRPSRRAFSYWTGIAMLLVALGQTASGIGRAPGLPPFPPSGLLVLLLGLALLVGSTMGTSFFAHLGKPYSTLVLDAVLLGLAASLLMWQIGFRDILESRSSGPVIFIVVLTLVSDVIIGTACLIAALRCRTSGTAVLAVGCLIFIEGDLTILRSTALAVQGIPWGGATLWCLGISLVAAGLMDHGLRGPSGPGAFRATSGEGSKDPEEPSSGRTTTLGLALLGIGIAATVAGRGTPADAVSIWLVLLTVVALWCREIINSRGRNALLERLHRAATTDPLTGLANRRVLSERMETVAHDAPWCLLCVDLDGFKVVNDLLGHATGDSLLCVVSKKIRQVLPPRTLVCRIGGDEFAVLVRGDVEHGLELGRKVIAAVHRSSSEVPGGDLVSVSASVGVASVGRATIPVAVGSGHLVVDPLAALSAASSAMRAAKQPGRERVQAFDHTAALARQRRLVIEHRLRLAVDDGKVTVHFQPIIDLHEGRVSSAEALARWDDDVLGTVRPDEFIPVAEESGLVIALGEHVLHESLSQASSSGMLQHGVRVACNVSPLQLHVKDFHRVIEDALTAHRVRPESLTIEVTEAVLVDEDGPAVRALTRLANLGVTIAIDDFGTGYSSLGYLQRFPAKILKVDRSLTTRLLQDQSDRAIVKAIVDLGKGIGMAVVVEGVEDRGTAQAVAGLGARYGQGYLFGSAVPADVLIQALRGKAMDAILPAREPGTGKRVANTAGSARPPANYCSDRPVPPALADFT